LLCLTGFMGSGKTTVGRLLAQHIGWHFADLDSDIEATAGMSIARIFEERGEHAFRQMEWDVLSRLVEKSCSLEQPTVLALGGEVVVDYALRVKQEYGARGMVVAGYSNDVMAYIPSLRVLKEGGYEAADSMIYYGQPGAWDEQVEESIFAAIHRALERVKRQRAR